MQIIDVDALERFNSVWIVTGGKGVGSGIVVEAVIKVGKSIVHALGFAPLETGARPAVPSLFGIEVGAMGTLESVFEVGHGYVCPLL